jgi:hypothetical protein
LTSFYEKPILNSPYRAPEWHHPLDENGQPLDGSLRPGRRPSRIIVPVPASRKKASSSQGSLDLETYTDHGLINEIRDWIVGLEHGDAEESERVAFDAGHLRYQAQLELASVECQNSM